MSTDNGTYAILAICARDADQVFTDICMSNPAGNPVFPPSGDINYGYLTAAYWNPIAQLRCKDGIISNGDDVYYGLFLECIAAVGPFNIGDYLIAVRGTMSLEEWLNNALAEIPENVANVPGMVATGFWDVYNSMYYCGLDRSNIQKPAAQALANYIKAAPEPAGAAKIFVAGHSLGAALSTYLRYDLQSLLTASFGNTILTYLYASPRTGTNDYVMAYKDFVPSYNLIIYDPDPVPNTPSNPPFFTLVAGGPNHNVLMLKSASGDNPFDFGANHSPITYARLLDPNNTVAQRLPV